jgi:hypothetical protein
MHVCPLPRKASINRRRAYRPDIMGVRRVESFSGRDCEASEVCRKLVMVRDVWPEGECRLAPGKTAAGFSTKPDK